MNNLLSYKNYYGTVEYSAADDCLFGKVTGVKSLISYEGSSLNELKSDFENAVDEYLEDCKERNVTPEISIAQPIEEDTVAEWVETIIKILAPKGKTLAVVPIENK
ncbi:MAG: toxin-antitoxin system HicB family antitoxin [Clostridiales bacterium]|nr:toxin-antitoxin system HicB family antitoxin [Clostridiales bacterium]